MTVAEIQEFIIEKLNNKPILEIQNYGENEPQKLFVPLEHYGKTLEEIKSMLDELEQEKNMYNELENKIVRGESIPLMANEEFIEMLEKDTELKENNK